MSPRKIRSCDTAKLASEQARPCTGIPELRQAVARHSQRYSGIPVDWQSETLVTVGATEALAAAFLGLVNPGDEVCSLLPAHGTYATRALAAGTNSLLSRLHAAPSSEYRAGAQS